MDDAFNHSQLTAVPQSHAHLDQLAETKGLFKKQRIHALKSDIHQDQLVRTVDAYLTNAVCSDVTRAKFVKMANAFLFQDTVT
jgi:hypothetical protein